eukprot:6203895-Pleurochrysis_carterae.AAC.1
MPVYVSVYIPRYSYTRTTGYCSRRRVCRLPEGAPNTRRALYCCCGAAARSRKKWQSTMHCDASSGTYPRRTNLAPAKAREMHTREALVRKLSGQNLSGRDSVTCMDLIPCTFEIARRLICEGGLICTIYK